MLSKLFKKFRGSLPPTLSYGIFKPCTRCVYQKHSEPILIVSASRGPRIVLDPSEGCYVRVGDCIGYEKCGKCFEAIKGKVPYCKWKSFCSSK